ncbi:TlpA disulfide reductase family protein [Winogradskyella sp. UBA3174]|uniref:TlpA disulfide reductase family protein n=1 Tax=Winogradskyella sp. UBA3174 TaxID=1947785 RepID=UPI0025F21E00|nr:TlpA disulfide reductase family protein [Winogradskyella sp. UBA3174]|tara:strand:+ start:9191 stop:10186 length:996 start_codon:yes stop_codon:yes gene_type:complete
MKKVLPLVLLAFFSCKENEQKFNTKVTGIIENVKDSSKIYLEDFYFKDVGGYLDSTYVINNKFEFNFELQEPRSFQFNGVNTSAKHMLLSPGHTKLIISNLDSIHKLEVDKGSQETFQNEEYSKKYGYENNMDYLKNNPDNMTSLIILWEDRFSISEEELKTYYNTLTDKWKNTTAANDIEELLKLDYVPEIGANFLDFELKDANDNIISLSNFKDKYLLIEFTATWCGPCIAQIPFQKSAYEKYNSKDFEILHIYIEDKENMVKNVNKHKTPWKSVYAPKKFRSSVALNNRVYYLPNMFLLDKNHKIIGTTLNPVLMMDGLEKVLQEKIK